MQTSSTSIYAAAAAVVALLAALLWYLSARRFRMASTSEELLDLFEDRQATLEEHAIPASSNDKNKAPESAPAAAPLDLAPKGDKSTSPSTRCFRAGREGDKPRALLRVYDQRNRTPAFTARLIQMQRVIQAVDRN
jgi:hypothetical protein